MRPDLATARAATIRQLCRLGEIAGPTAGMAMGRLQANLVAVPRELAYDFLLFCQRNPKPCPLIDVTDVGDVEPRGAAVDSDLRTDLPRYRLWKHGELAMELDDARPHWGDDFVGFLIGCSFTFEAALLASSLPVRHIEEGRNVPMYVTDVECRPAGVFRGPLVVSMRPMTPEQAIRAAAVTARYPRAHGAPVHWGDPAALGIADLNRPEFGDCVDVRPGEVPVFWACGVTPQAALMRAKVPVAITHAPGCMFVTDLGEEAAM